MNSREQEIWGAAFSILSLQSPKTPDIVDVEVVGTKKAECLKAFKGLFLNTFTLIDAEDTEDSEDEIPEELFESITRFHVLISTYSELLSGEQILLLTQTFYALLSEIAFYFTEDGQSYGMGMGFLTIAQESLKALALKK